MILASATLKRIGRTPEARVRWVLDFVSRDPERLSRGAQRVAFESLVMLYGGARFPATDPKAIDGTHRALQQCVEHLANGRPTEVRVPETVWLLIPPPRRPTGARHSAPIKRWAREALVEPRRFAPAMAVLAFVDDLNAIDADRLRACPLEQAGERCGVVFLGTRGKRYCTSRHAQAAAWQAYLDRHGADRKLRRK